MILVVSVSRNPLFVLGISIIDSFSWIYFIIWLVLWRLIVIDVCCNFLFLRREHISVRSISRSFTVEIDGGYVWRPFTHLVLAQASGDVRIFSQLGEQLLHKMRIRGVNGEGWLNVTRLTGSRWRRSQTRCLVANRWYDRLRFPAASNWSREFEYEYGRC